MYNLRDLRKKKKNQMHMVHYYSQLNVRAKPLL